MTVTSQTPENTESQARALFLSRTGPLDGTEYLLDVDSVWVSQGMHLSKTLSSQLGTTRVCRMPKSVSVERSPLEQSTHGTGLTPLLRAITSNLRDRLPWAPNQSVPQTGWHRLLPRSLRTERFTPPNP